MGHPVANFIFLTFGARKVRVEPREKRKKEKKHCRPTRGSPLLSPRVTSNKTEFFDPTAYQRPRSASSCCVALEKESIRFAEVPPGLPCHPELRFSRANYDYIRCSLRPELTFHTARVIMTPSENKRKTFRMFPGRPMNHSTHRCYFWRRAKLEANLTAMHTTVERAPHEEKRRFLQNLQ